MYTTQLGIYTDYTQRHVLYNPKCNLRRLRVRREWYRSGPLLEWCRGGGFSLQVLLSSSLYSFTTQSPTGDFLHQSLCLKCEVTLCYFFHYCGKISQPNELCLSFSRLSLWFPGLMQLVRTLWWWEFVAGEVFVTQWQIEDEEQEGVTDKIPQVTCMQQSILWS